MTPRFFWVPLTLMVLVVAAVWVAEAALWGADYARAKLPVRVIAALIYGLLWMRRLYRQDLR